jgi:mannose-6-phosphate isomerase-like protein (cupin superfamily)
MASSRLQRTAAAVTLSPMKTRNLLMVLCLCAGTVLAQDAKPAAPVTSSATVEITAEPSHHLKIDNPYIRAFYIEVAPQQSTLMHHHGKDYIAVAFGHTEIDSVAPDGTVKHVVLEDGDVRYTPAGLTHVAADKASTTFRNATIELMENNGHPVCVNKCQDDPRAKDWPALHEGSKLIGYGDTFRITEATIQPKQTISTDEPFPHLVVVLTDMQVHTGPQGSGGMDFNQKAGDMIFHGGHADHGLTNTSDQPLRLVVVEFKPAKE